MRAIGIDLGTTSLCGVLVDTDTGRVLRSLTKNSHAFLQGAYSWERIQSPEKIIAMARRILEELLPEGAAAIGVTGQMHGILYVDRQGQAVSPLYTWQDGRGNEPYQGVTYAQYLNSHSGYGHVTDFYNTVNGLIPPRAAGFCTIQDYLVMQLCGLKKPVIHASDAASFGCFNLEKRAFARACDLDVVFGYGTAGAFRGVPVSIAIGDNQASVFSCLRDKNNLLINVGTGSQVSILSDQIVAGPGLETRPYVDETYLVVGSALCGGRAYAVLKDFFARVLSYGQPVDDEQVYALMARMAQGLERSSLRVDPRFCGTRGDESLRGSIREISCENFTPEELTWGLMEGMAKELHDLYRLMGTERRGIIASGNGIRRNPALQRAVERVFSAPLRIPAHTEEAACGAALYALVAAGRCPTAQQAQQMIHYQ
ncbi:MAG: hypothetical protein IJ461_04875 [Clostridia bacterium]|nr:hypothetical protein [Clostridia bacterium]